MSEDVNSLADQLLVDDDHDVNLAADELLNDEAPHEPMPGIIPAFARHAANVGVGAGPIYQGAKAAVGRMVGLSPDETRADDADRGIKQLDDIKHFTLDPSDLLTAYQEGYGKERDYQKMLTDKRPIASGAGEVFGNIALLAASPKKLIAPLEAIPQVAKGIQAIKGLPLVGKALGYGAEIAKNTVNAAPMIAAQTAMNPEVPMEQVPEQIQENMILAPIANVGIDAAVGAGKVGYKGAKAIGNFIAPDFAIGKKLGQMGINVMGDAVSDAGSKFGQYYNNLIDDILNPISKHVETNVAKEKQMIGVANANYRLAETGIKSEIDRFKNIKANIGERIDKEAANNADEQIRLLQDKLSFLQAAKDKAKLDTKETYLKGNTDKGHTFTQKHLGDAEEVLKSNYDLIDDQAKDIKFNINKPLSEFYNDPVVMGIFAQNPEKAEVVRNVLQAYDIDGGGVGRDTFKKLLNGLTVNGKRQPAELDKIIGGLFPELSVNGALGNLKQGIRQDQYQQLIDAGRPDIAEFLMKTNQEFSTYKPLFDKFLPRNDYNEITSSAPLMSGVKSLIESKYNPEISNSASDFVKLIDKIPDPKVKASIMKNLEGLNMDKVNMDELVKANIDDIAKVKRQIDFVKKEIKDNDQFTTFAAEKNNANRAIDRKLLELESHLVNAQKKLDNRLSQYSISGKPQENIIDKITAKSHPYDRNEAISNVVRSNDTLTKNSPLNTLLDAVQPTVPNVDLRSKAKELNDILGLSQTVGQGFKGAFDPSMLKGNLDGAGRITGATTKSMSGIVGNVAGRTMNAITDNPIARLVKTIPPSYTQPLKQIVESANKNKKQALIFAMLQEQDFREALEKAGIKMEDFTIDSAESVYNTMMGK